MSWWIRSCRLTIAPQHHEFGIPKELPFEFIDGFPISNYHVTQDCSCAGTFHLCECGALFQSLSDVWQLIGFWGRWRSVSLYTPKKWTFMWTLYGPMRDETLAVATHSTCQTFSNFFGFGEDDVPWVSTPIKLNIHVCGSVWDETLAVGSHKLNADWGKPLFLQGPAIRLLWHGFVDHDCSKWKGKNSCYFAPCLEPVHGCIRTVGSHLKRKPSETCACAGASASRPLLEFLEGRIGDGATWTINLIWMWAATGPPCNLLAKKRMNNCTFLIAVIQGKCPTSISSCPGCGPGEVSFFMIFQNIFMHHCRCKECSIHIIKFASNFAAVLQETALFGNGPAFAAATRKMSRFGEASANASSNFWRQADLPVAPWIKIDCPKN